MVSETHARFPSSLRPLSPTGLPLDTRGQEEAARCRGREVGARKEGATHTPPSGRERGGATGSRSLPASLFRGSPPTLSPPSPLASTAYEKRNVEPGRTFCVERGRERVTRAMKGRSEEWHLGAGSLTHLFSCCVKKGLCLSGPRSLAHTLAHTHTRVQGTHRAPTGRPDTHTDARDGACFGFSSLPPPLVPPPSSTRPQSNACALRRGDGVPV